MIIYVDHSFLIEWFCASTHEDWTTTEKTIKRTLHESSLEKNTNLYKILLRKWGRSKRDKINFPQRMCKMSTFQPKWERFLMNEIKQFFLQIIYDFIQLLLAISWLHPIYKRNQTLTDQYSYSLNNQTFKTNAHQITNN